MTSRERTGPDSFRRHEANDMPLSSPVVLESGQKKWEEFQNKGIDVDRSNSKISLESRCSTDQSRDSSSETSPLLMGVSNAKAFLSGYNVNERRNSVSPPLENLPSSANCQQELSDGLGASCRCNCHPEPKPKDNKARNKLIVAAILSLLFMCGEIAGGAISNSLAILTDAAHMLSDFASFLISLFAIWMANRPATTRLSFGWHRAEVLGAVVSVFLIWLLTGVLVYEAIQRCINQDYEINTDVMLITACIGVFVNVFMIGVLHQHSHGHNHGPSHSQSGHDDHDDHDGNNVKLSKSRNHSSKSGVFGVLLRWLRGRSVEYEAKELLQDSEEGISKAPLKRCDGQLKTRKAHNINVRAAFIHVIGDLIQSIGVVIAAYIIRFKPEWKLADPICTFLFSLLVLFSTFAVLRDALAVLMEASPRGINYREVLQELQKVTGVKMAHSLHMWSLTMDKAALSVHLAVDTEGVPFQKVLSDASTLLRLKYGFQHTTIQVEDFHLAMTECDKCQRVLPQTSGKWLLSCWCAKAED